MKQPDLWQKIAAFSLDDPDSEFKFSDRLARENGWSLDYTHRVIEEYKKFIYLCATSEHSITPSDPVDQAWHLHLTYTRSYWVSLCRETLGKEIHHGPTKGGKKEGDKFKDWYGLTFQLYQEAFGTAPPEDIWWHTERRFKEIHFTRVNRTRYWLLPKPGTNTKRQVILSLLAILTFGLFSYAINGFTIFFYVLVAIIFLSAIFGKGKGGGKNSGCSTDSSSDWGDSDSGCGSSGCGSGCGGCGD